MMIELNIIVLCVSIMIYGLLLCFMLSRVIIQKVN